jgi:anti-sigma regulatory factor (Ser/Thr protein kinase)
VAPPSDQDEHSVRRTRSAAGRTQGVTELLLTLSADWVAPSIARERVSSWLHAHHWPPAQIEELVLAVSEAVSNSVEHGYHVPLESMEHTDTVQLLVRMSVAADGYRRAEFVVIDQGSWREPVDGSGNRGHGMLIMRSCTDELTVHGTSTGTTVTLRSRPAPPLP